MCMQEDAFYALAKYPDNANEALAYFLKMNPGQAGVFESCRTEWDGDGFQCQERNENGH